jgi:outer membrane protein TolC
MIQRPDGTQPSPGIGVPGNAPLPAGAGGRKTGLPLLAFFLFFLCGGLLAAQESAQAAPETPLPGGGPEARRLSADEAVRLAIQYNLGLETARIALDTKRRKSDLVWNQFLPDLEVRGTLAGDNEKSDPVSVTAPIPLPGSGTPITIPGVGSGTLYSSGGVFVSDPRDVPRWHVQGNISANLILTSALFAGIKTIRQDYQTGIVTFEKAKIQLERDVRKTYYQMLLLEESLTVQRDSLASAERQVGIAQANYNSGLAPELTLLQARVNRDNLLPDFEEFENNRKLAMANFAMLLGLPYDTRFELIPLTEDLRYADLDMTELISKAASGKIDILELQQQILYLKNARTAQALQLWTPNLILGWNWTPTFIADPWKDDWGNKDLWQKSGAFSITLQWKLNNLFPFTKEGQGLKDVDNQLKTLNIGLAQMVRGTELEVYNTVLSLEKTRASIAARNQTVALARESYNSTERAYRAGLQDSNSVQNAAEALRQARMGVAQQQFSYLLGLIDLEYALGVPFGTLSGGGAAASPPAETAEPGETIETTETAETTETIEEQL